MSKTSMVIGGIIFFVFSCILFSSCEKEGGNERNISTWDDDESHYTGENCMDCHYRAGEGEGWFTAAGTLTGDFRNAIVVLNTEPGRTGVEVDRIEVDRLGNFYTTESLSFSQGLYVTVIDKDGWVREMGSIVHSGACSTCHGKQQPHISL